MPSTAPQVPVAVVGSTRNCVVDFTGVLDPTETLTGTPTLAEQTTSDLTLASPAVNTSEIPDFLGRFDPVEVGKAVTFVLSGHLANTKYRIKITVGTSSSQTIVRYVEFRSA